MEQTREPRRLRQRAKRRYTEEIFADEEIEGRRMFSVEDKLNSKFEADFVNEMKGEDLTLHYIQENGFETPILVRNKEGLGIKVPDKNFNVDDVRQCVGNKRLLDVMDVTTQKDIEMTMREWCTYYNDLNRDRLLNVISLEFSHTKLESYVEAPTIVKQLDWVDWIWPKHLKESQTEGTNSIEDMKYPKVQKYCLMSVKGCFTDFHIDFGGTSVWYHILKGKKIFWLIPPSERNIQLFEQWVLSGKQSDIFFGDLCGSKQCSRVQLEEGHTFFIPTGWIHSVYTPEDSLVFGGNFLQSFSIEKQLRIAQVEDITKVPVKFRYPFYNEMLWYVLQRYVYCLSGKNHLVCDVNGQTIREPDVQTHNSFHNSLSQYNTTINKCKDTTNSVHITPYELNGLKSIIMCLSRLSNNKRCVPELIANPEALLNDAKLLVDDHSSDSHQKACTNKCVLFWEPKTKNPLPTNQLSLTAQLRQIKNPLHSAKVLLNNVSNNNITTNNKNNSLDQPIQRPVRPESPPTRPLSSNQYAVTSAISTQTWDRIPSSFAELIAATGVGSHNKNTFSLPTPSWQSSSISTTHNHSSLSVEKFDKEKELNVDLKEIPFLPPPPPVATTQTVDSEAAVSKMNTKISNDNSRRRRTRCKKCDACVRADCGDCHFCKDMKKFGGPGRMKQSCIARQCISPVLPHTACCMVCGRDGWEKLTPTIAGGETQSSLMECSLCWEIVHPFCLKEKDPTLLGTGNINLDLPNSWECLKCIQGAKNGQGKPRNNKQSNTSINLKNCNTSQSRQHSIESLKKPRFEEKNESSSSDNGIRSCESDTDDETSSCYSASTNDTNETVQTHSNSKANYSSSLLSSSSNSSVSVSHVRSCARFPLLQEAIKQQQQQKQLSISHSHNHNVSQQNQHHQLQKQLSKDTQSIKTNIFSPKNSKCSPITLNTEIKINQRSKKQCITSRDRLFKSLKGLKKNSELMRFTNSSNLTSNQLSFVKKAAAINKLTSQSSENSETCNKNLQELEVKTEDLSQKSSSVFDADTDNENEENEAKSEDETSRNRIKFETYKRNIHPTLGQELKKPKYVVRPAPFPEDMSDTEEEEYNESNSNDEEENSRKQLIKKWLKKLEKKRADNLSLERDVILPVLSHLSRKDLQSCMSVCKIWNTWCMEPKLWKRLDLSKQKLNSTILTGIIKRQPLELFLSWTDINIKQLRWLIMRLPQLHHLSLAGCSASLVTGLSTINCPLIKTLDLSWVDSLNDNIMKEILSPPVDSRPGLMETKTRLRQLVELKLAGSNISDTSLRLISHNLPSLTKIDLSNCHKITDIGIASLGAAKSKNLISLNVSSCCNITDTSLDALRRCESLEHLDAQNCSNVSITACFKFISVSKRNDLKMVKTKLISK